MARRVRGRWITGHFVLRHSAATRRGLKPDASPAANYRGPDDPSLTTAALKPNSAAEPRNKTEPASPVGVAQSGASQAVWGAESLASDERVLKLQKALHIHARNLATSTEPASGGLSSPRSVPASAEPKAVSFDFQSGVKTTVFADGTIGAVACCVGIG